MYFTWLNERQCSIVLLNFLVLSYLVTGFSILSNIWKTFASVQIRLKVITRFSYYRRLTKL